MAGSDDLKHTFDLDENVNTEYEHMIDGGGGLGNGGYVSTEDYLRQLDKYLQMPQWSRDDYDEYRRLASAATSVNDAYLTQEDEDFLLSYTPPYGVTTSYNSDVTDYEECIEGYNKEDTDKWIKRHEPDLTPEQVKAYHDKFGDDVEIPTTPPVTTPQKQEAPKKLDRLPEDPDRYKEVEGSSQTNFKTGDRTRKLVGLDGKTYLEIKDKHGLVSYLEIPDTQPPTKSDGSTIGAFVEPTTPPDKQSVDPGFSASDMSRKRKRAYLDKKNRENISLNGVVLGDKKIVDDSGILGRPNAGETDKEQELGDFHVDLDRLARSAEIAINLESAVNSFVDHITPECDFKPVYIDTYLVNIDESTLDCEPVKKAIKQLKEDSKEPLEMVTNIADLIADFINCLRYTSDEIEDLFANYFRDWALSEVDKILAEDQDNIHVHAFDNIIKRYLERDLYRYAGSSEEWEKIYQAMAAVGQWEYEKMDWWGRAQTDARTCTTAFIFGVGKRFEQIGDGFLTYTSQVLYDIAPYLDNFGYGFGVDLGATSGAAQMQHQLRAVVADSGADNAYHEFSARQHMNLYSANGKYKDAGFEAGKLTTDLVMKIVTAPAGPVAQTFLLACGKQGEAAQRNAQNTALTDAQYAHQNGLSGALNVGFSLLEVGNSKIPVRTQDGSLFVGGMLTKANNSGMIALAKTTGEKYIDYSADTATGATDKSFIEYMQEDPNLPKTYVKKYIETTVNSIGGSVGKDNWFGNFYSKYGKFTKYYGKGRNTAMVLTGDTSLQKAESFGGVLSDSVDLFVPDVKTPN